MIEPSDASLWTLGDALRDRERLRGFVLDILAHRIGILGIKWSAVKVLAEAPRPDKWVRWQDVVAE